MKPIVEQKNIVPKNNYQFISAFFVSAFFSIIVFFANIITCLVALGFFQYFSEKYFNDRGNELIPIILTGLFYLLVVVAVSLFVYGNRAKVGSEFAWSFLIFNLLFAVPAVVVSFYSVLTMGG